MLRVQKTIFVMLILAIVIANPTLVVTIVKSVLMDFLDSQLVKVAVAMKKELLVQLAITYLENVIVGQTLLEIDATNVLPDSMDTQTVNHVYVTMMDPGISPAMMTLESVPVKPMSLVTNASSVLQEILDSLPVMVKSLYSNYGTIVP